MSEHELSLMQDFEETDGSWFAECTCGWVGPERSAQYQAVKDHEAWHGILAEKKKEAVNDL